MRLPIPALVVAIFCSVSFASARKPAVINPVVPVSDTSKVTNLGVKVYLIGIDDARQGGTGDTLGRTRVGMRTTVPIVSVPPVAEVMKTSLNNTLARIGSQTGDRYSARYAVHLILQDYRITESSGFFQSIRCQMRFEAVIQDAMSGQEIRRFSIESEDEKKSFDTTKHAERVARNALKWGVFRLLESMSKI